MFCLLPFCLELPRSACCWCRSACTCIFCHRHRQACACTIRHLPPAQPAPASSAASATPGSDPAWPASVLSAAGIAPGTPWFPNATRFVFSSSRPVLFQPLATSPISSTIPPSASWCSNTASSMYYFLLWLVQFCVGVLSRLVFLHAPCRIVK